MTEQRGKARVPQIEQAREEQTTCGKLDEKNGKGRLRSTDIGRDDHAYREVSWKLSSGELGMQLLVKGTKG